MSFIYLDIETIPAQSEDVRAAIAETVKPPANMKKAETIAAWETNDKRQAVADAIAKTALDGAFGHICCIGFAINDDEPETINLCAYSRDAEASLLERFFIATESAVPHTSYYGCLVGHNIINFDIRFIWQRAFALGVRVPGWFPLDPKPWDRDVFDTMLAFAGSRGTVSLDRLCKAIGIDGKGDVDGSMVGQMWAEGRYSEIAAYCKQDVERVRKVHSRLAFVMGDAA